jgi:RNA polymerase primary sigma factor
MNPSEKCRRECDTDPTPRVSPIDDRSGEAEAGLKPRVGARADEGDVELRNRVVQSNLRLVSRVARQYLNRGLTYEDLIGEGNLGLIRAAQRFDPSQGTKFSTYANYWIRDAIVAALSNTTSTIRLPAHISRLLGRWRRTETVLYHRHGRRPTFEEVAAALGLDRAKLRLIARAHCVTRVQKPGAEREDGPTHGLRMVEGGDAPEVSLAAEEEKASISQRLAGLSSTERTIIVLRFGLNGEPPLSLEQIGQRLNLPTVVVQKRFSVAIRDMGSHRGRQAPGYDRAFDSRVG